MFLLNWVTIIEFLEHSVVRFWSIRTTRAGFSSLKVMQKCKKYLAETPELFASEEKNVPLRPGLNPQLLINLTGLWVCGVNPGRFVGLTPVRVVEL